MKKQVKKLVVLLGVAGACVLMSFNEPRWYEEEVAIHTICRPNGNFVMIEYNEYLHIYYGYCVCNPGWFGDRCEFNEDDL